MNGFICKALAVHTSNIIYLNIYTQVIYIQYIQIPQIPYKPTPKEVNDGCICHLVGNSKKLKK